MWSTPANTSQRWEISKKTYGVSLTLPATGKSSGGVRAPGALKVGLARPGKFLIAICLRAAQASLGDGFRLLPVLGNKAPSFIARMIDVQFPHQFADADAGARAGRHAPRRLPSALEPACCRCARSSPWSQRTPPRATDGKPGKSGNLFGRWTFPTLQFPGKLSLVHA